MEKRKILIEKFKTEVMDINKLVDVAQEKLVPVIECIVKNSTHSKSNFITKEQFENAILASKIIADISFTLKLDSVEKLVNNLNFNLENAKVIVNSQGLIFVDTALLLQLIDLHTILEEFIEYIDPSGSDEADGLTQTDSSVATDVSEIPKLNKFTVKMSRPKNSAKDWPTLTDFIVLPTLKDHEDDNDSEMFIPHIQRAKSVGFLTEEETINVTDVIGARDIIEKCICDLERVQCFMINDFKKPAADGFTDTKMEQLEEKRRSSGKNEKSVDHCCCSGNCGKIDVDREDLRVCGEDNVVICIKGCHPDDGDVQIVIKQCPDCKSICAPCPSQLQTDKDISSDREHLDFVLEKQNKDEGTDKTIKEPISAVPQERERTPTPPVITERTPMAPMIKEITPTAPIIDSLPQEVASDVSQVLDNLQHLQDVKEEQQNISSQDGNSAQSSASSKPPEQNQTSTDKDSENDILQRLSDLNIIFPPIPSPDITHTLPKKKMENQQKPLEEQYQFRNEHDCTKMRLNEAQKLCFDTEKGEELLITLTVTPNTYKKVDDDQTFLKKLFSDEDTLALNSHKQHPKLETSKTANNKDITQHTQQIQNVNSETDSEEPETQINYGLINNNEERVIPLERTKVCSSLEFDVKLVDTKIRRKGINANDKSIVVELKKMGVDNLLRACRPAKCCRKSVLNEKMKKYLPYPPSLKSLPLDKNDLSVINQSLQMSLQKVKNSTDLHNTFQEQQTYCLNKFKIMYSMVDKSNQENQIKNWLQRKKLNYFINLVNDKCQKGPLLKYSVMYFEVQTKGTNDRIDKQKIKNNINSTSKPRSKTVNVDLLEIVSDPITYIKERYKFRDERPLKEPNSFLCHSKEIPCQKLPKIFTEVPSIKSLKTPVLSQQKEQNCYKNLKSKIPVLRPKLLNRPKVSEANMEVFRLKSGDKYLDYENQATNSSQFQGAPKNKFWGHTSKRELVRNYVTAILSEESHSGSMLSKRNSRNIILKGRRKKREFCSLRSQSEISLNQFSQFLLNSNRKKFHSIQKLSVVKVNKAVSGNQNYSYLDNKSEINIQDIAKQVLKFLSEILYKMLVKEIIHENTLLKVVEGNSLIIPEESLRENFRDLFKNSTFQQSSKCSKQVECHICQDTSFIACENPWNNNKIRLPIQTSISSKLNMLHQECQTISIVNLINHQSKNIQLVPKAFGRSCNTEWLQKYPLTGDEEKNFLVVFRSVNANNNASNISTINVPSATSSIFGSLTEESISQSLLTLNEALMDCEKMTTKQVAMNPVEYMVYQNYVKSSSFFQKLVNKTKDIFGADNEKKYCKICKCRKTKCLEHTDEKPAGCSCPDEYKKFKPKKDADEKPRDKSKWCHLSSISTFKDIKTKIKKSVTNVLKRNKGQYVNICSSSKPCRNVETMACSPDCVIFRHEKHAPNLSNLEEFGNSKHLKNIETSTRRLEFNEKINKVDQKLEAIISITDNSECINNQLDTIENDETLKEQNKPNETLTENKGLIPNEIKISNLENRKNIDINLGECFCEEYCNRNNRNCCCETCPGCNFSANYFTTQNIPKFILSAAKANNIRYDNIGYTPQYSVLIPQNLFDINNNLARNNPFQNNYT